jgi:hypothetical protein
LWFNLENQKEALMKRMLVGGSLILGVAGHMTANAYAQAQVMENPGWILVGGGMVNTLAILTALYLHTKNFRYHYPFVMLMADLSAWASGFSIYKTVEWVRTNQVTGTILGSFGSFALIAAALILLYLSEPHEIVLRGPGKGIRNRRGPMTARKFWAGIAWRAIIIIVGAVWLIFLHESFTPIIIIGLTAISIGGYTLADFLIHNYPD